MRKWIPPMLALVAAGASLLVFNRLPARIPTHWAMDGHVDGWSSRAWGAFVIPVVMLGITGVMRLVPLIDPRRENYPKFSGMFEVLFISITAFMLGTHLVLLAAGLGYPVAIERWLPIGLGALFIVIGNLLPRARPNWFVGIRTPWTLSSDRVWEKTHRMGGYVFVMLGVIVAVAGGLSARLMVPGLAVLISFAALSVIVYSYVEWRKEASAPPPTTTSS